VSDKSGLALPLCKFVPQQNPVACSTVNRSVQPVLVGAPRCQRRHCGRMRPEFQRWPRGVARPATSLCNVVIPRCRSGWVWRPASVRAPKHRGFLRSARGYLSPKEIESRSGSATPTAPGEIIVQECVSTARSSVGLISGAALPLAGAVQVKSSSSQNRVVPPG
jgi:hypothetical protein